MSKLVDVPRLLDESAGIGVRLSEHVAGQPLAFSGVWGSLRGVFAAAIARHASHILMLLPEAADADVVAGDALAFGVDDAVSLPLSASEASASSIRDDDYADRLQVLQRLVARDTGAALPLLVTAYIGGAMQLVPTPEQLEASTRRIAVGDEVEPETIRRWLAESGFSATTAVQLPGEFAARGGLLDVYSADQPQPIRIEWFGDEVESIRRFDPGSQRSIESLEQVEIAAVGITSDTRFEHQDAITEVGYTESDNEDPDAAENTTPSTQGLGGIAEYLPDNTLVVVVDPHECERSANALKQRSGEAANLMSFQELIESLATYRMVTGTTLATGNRDEIVDLHSTTADGFALSLDETRTRLDSVAKADEIVLVGDTPADGE